MFGRCVFRSKNAPTQRKSRRATSTCGFLFSELSAADANASPNPVTGAVHDPSACDVTATGIGTPVGGVLWGIAVGTVRPKHYHLHIIFVALYFFKKRTRKSFPQDNVIALEPQVCSHVALGHPFSPRNQMTFAE